MTTPKIGFHYFQSPKRLMHKQIENWLPALTGHGATYIVVDSGFNRAFPEDVSIQAHKNGLDMIVHFKEELPLVRRFNEVMVLLNAYAKWEINKIILGDVPNCKSSWPASGWQFENLVDHFLDRFIPLANHVIRLGMTPILPPPQPGGDYWDTAFIEAVLDGLKRRKLNKILTQLELSSYGFTYSKPLSWGAGGPERWSSSKPYQTPKGQENQIGFHNFEWYQMIARKNLGQSLPIIILNAGHPGHQKPNPGNPQIIQNIQKLIRACQSATQEKSKNSIFTELVYGCTFSLDTFEQLTRGEFNPENLSTFFGEKSSPKNLESKPSELGKNIDHYMLLPLHASGVSDALLNRIRPYIKKFQPTIGFSFNEALRAKKVTIFPDGTIFTDDHLKYLRNAGCEVEILPDTGIDIATRLKRPSLSR